MSFEVRLSPGLFDVAFRFAGVVLGPIFFVAEALKQDFRFTSTLSPTLNHTFVFNLAACMIWADFFENRLLAFTEKVRSEENQLLQSQRILWIKNVREGMLNTSCQKNWFITCAISMSISHRQKMGSGVLFWSGVKPAKVTSSWSRTSS